MFGFEIVAILCANILLEGYYKGTWNRFLRKEIINLQHIPVSHFNICIYERPLVTFIEYYFRTRATVLGLFNTKKYGDGTSHSEKLTCIRSFRIINAIASNFDTTCLTSTHISEIEHLRQGSIHYFASTSLLPPLYKFYIAML